MNLTKNEIKILKALISSQSYTSSYDIAKATGINRRLVRDEITNIKKLLKFFGYELVSKNSRGYLIESKTSRSLQPLAKLIENAERKEEHVIPTLPWERQTYIVRYIIESNNYIKIDDLAELLLVSRSTISNDLKCAKKDIKKYNLSFKQKPNYGICIVGSEINKRTRICDLLFSNLKRSSMFYDYLNSYFSDKTSLEYGIIKIIKTHQIELSDFALCDFLLCLSFSLKRIISGQTIIESQDLSLINGRNEFIVARDIANFIEEKIQCEITENEINQMAIQLICKRSITAFKSSNSFEINVLVQEIFNEIKKQTLLNLNTPRFTKTFALYIETVIIRITYHEKVRNPLYDRIKEAYLLAYTCADITSSIIYKYTKKSLSSSELAYLSILFHKEIYCKKDIEKKTLLINGLGNTASDISETLILEKFKNKISIVKKTQYYKLNDEDLSQYDLIISTAPIHHSLPIPCINIPQIIGNDDLEEIENKLSFIFDKLKLESIFNPRLFKTQLKLKDKIEVIDEFYNLLNSQYIPIKESFKNNLILEDRHTITYFKPGIAIIKLNKLFNSQNIISVLILEKPIEWDKKEIQIFILYSCSDVNYYNAIANSLSHFSSHENKITTLINNPSYQNFIKTLKKYQ